MLRRVSRKLQLIRYYSATRRSTAWTRAVDVALIVTLLAAYPVTWLIDVTVVRSVTTRSVSGLIARDDAAAFEAGVSNDIAWLVENPNLTQAGSFTLSMTERRRGWPLTTSLDRRAVRLDLDLLDRPKPTPDARLEPDDPVRLAIEQELARAGPTTILEAWNETDPSGRSIRWPVVAVSGLMWWVILFLVAAIAIQMLRTAHTTHRRRVQQQQQERLRSGHCSRCGYDLRGLEFNERCPECGGLV